MGYFILVIDNICIYIFNVNYRLFTGTVRYNLTLGKECGEGDIWNTLEMIEIHEVIQRLPDKLDTQVAEGVHYIILNFMYILIRWF
jgi:ABC-type bacteriocin/lantibiotic exporter with double-glycine peptidase domain